MNNETIDKYDDFSILAAYDAQQAAERQAFDEKIAAARAELQATLNAPQNNEGTPEAALIRQGHILNTLFHKALEKCGDVTESDSALALALKLQRDCRQTAQAIARIRRMESLIHQNPDKRNDSSRFRDRLDAEANSGGA